MDLASFTESASGILVPITGTDPRYGEWKHSAFVPNPLPSSPPDLTASTYMKVADARAALAAFDSTVSQLENPRLLRMPSLRREAQSTSALEGTYAPLSDVLTADEHNPTNVNLREILNYVSMADHAYAAVLSGRPLTVGLLGDLQAMLVAGTPHEHNESGRVRSVQVVIGQRPDAAQGSAPVHASRFVPPPPGTDLTSRITDLIDWMNHDHSSLIDPVVASGMGHYQFETLHPFHDGNGRLGRLLMSIQLLMSGVINEPALTVSPWFEERRIDYYDRLLAVSAESDWDSWIAFYADGLQASAVQARGLVLSLTASRRQMHDVIRGSSLRAGTAYSLADFAVAHPSFTVRDVERGLKISYGRANRLVEQLIGLDILAELPTHSTSRRFHSPAVLDALVTAQ